MIKGNKERIAENKRKKAEIKTSLTTRQSSSRMYDKTKWRNFFYYWLKKELPTNESELANYERCLYLIVNTRFTSERPRLEPFLTQ